MKHLYAVLFLIFVSSGSGWAQDIPDSVNVVQPAPEAGGPDELHIRRYRMCLE